MNVNTFTDDRPVEAIDGLLDSYFKKEMPEPWPDVNVMTGSPIKTRSWLGAPSRLALVASLALILLGYLALAAKFPSAPESGLSLDRSQTIGSKLSVKPVHLAPAENKSLK